MKPKIIYSITLHTDAGDVIFQFGTGLFFKKIPKVIIKDGIKIKVAELTVFN